MDARVLTGGIQVIARAAAILRVCKDERAGLSLGQIADSVGLPRSTVQRIVQALAAEGLLVAGGAAHSIRIGPEIHALAEASGIDVVRIAHPFLKALSDRVGETVDLAALRHHQMIFIDQIAGPQRLRAVSAVGETFPLHCTANGKAALALMEADALARIRGLTRQALTPATITTWTGLMSDIEAIRHRGYALDREEHTVGISAVGAAFRDGAGRIYAVSIPVPTLRFAGREKGLARALLDTLELIGDALHHAG